MQADEANEVSSWQQTLSLPSCKDPKTVTGDGFLVVACNPLARGGLHMLNTTTGTAITTITSRVWGGLAGVELVGRKGLLIGSTSVYFNDVTPLTASTSGLGFV